MSNRLTINLETKTTGAKKNRRILIIFGPKTTPGDLEKLGHLNVLIDPKYRAELVDWLKGLTVDEAAEKMAVSRSWIGRIRSVLGIAGKYSGDSKTTKWRHKNE